MRVGDGWVVGERVTEGDGAVVLVGVPDRVGVGVVGAMVGSVPLETLL